MSRWDNRNMFYLRKTIAVLFYRSITQPWFEYGVAAVSMVQRKPPELEN